MSTPDQDASSSEEEQDPTKGGSGRVKGAPSVTWRADRERANRERREDVKQAVLDIFNEIPAFKSLLASAAKGKGKEKAPEPTPGAPNSGSSTTTRDRSPIRAEKEKEPSNAGDY